MSQCFVRHKLVYCWCTIKILVFYENPNEKQTSVCVVRVYCHI